MGQSQYENSLPRPPDEPLLGLMLRREWTRELIDRSSELGLGYIEVFPENYMRRGARGLAELEDLASSYPITTHGVHLSIAGEEGAHPDYLPALDRIIEAINPVWCSDHLGASMLGGEVFHEIVPAPFNEKTLERVCARADAMRDRIGRSFLLENAAYYLVPPGSDMDEITFFARMLENSKVGVLLDVNNLWLNATNHGYAPEAWLDAVDPNRIHAIHVGGFTVHPELGLLIDSHCAPPSPPVWRLLVDVYRRIGARPTLYEYEGKPISLDMAMGEVRTISRAWMTAQEPG